MSAARADGRRRPGLGLLRATALLHLADFALVPAAAALVASAGAEGAKGLASAAEPALGAAFWAATALAVVAAARGRSARLSSRAARAATGWAAALGALWIFAAFAPPPEAGRLPWIIAGVALGLAASLAARAAFAAAERRRSRRDRASGRALVGDDAFHARLALSRRAGRVVRLDGSEEPREILRSARGRRVEEVLVQWPPTPETGRLQGLLAALDELPADVHLCLDLSDLPVPPRRIGWIGGRAMIVMREQPRRRWRERVSTSAARAARGPRPPAPAAFENPAALGPGAFPSADG